MAINPKISVIVPIYKVEEYLKRCVTSLIHQTYQNLEIILVDDGSPDGCPALCDIFAKEDSRIKVIHKKNGGLSDARNAGIAIATGELFTFIDSDDFIHENMIATLYSLMESYKADISICNFEYFKSKPSVKAYCKPHIELVDGLEATSRLYQKKFATQTVVAWGKLYKRELFSEILYEVGKFNEDEYTTYKLLYKAEKVVYTSEKLYYYFLRDTGISKAITNPKSLDGFDAKENALAFYKKENQTQLCSMAAISFLNYTAKRYFWVKKLDPKNVQLDNLKDRFSRIFHDFKEFLPIFTIIRGKVFLSMNPLYKFYTAKDRLMRKLFG